jgi:hypothetical protein
MSDDLPDFSNAPVLTHVAREIEQWSSTGGELIAARARRFDGYSQLLSQSVALAKLPCTIGA